MDFIAMTMNSTFVAQSEASFAELWADDGASVCHNQVRGTIQVAATWLCTMRQRYVEGC